jgi:hypothetical protein
MEVRMPTSSTSQPNTGSVHRFGKNGVLYEVVREVDDKSVMIRVLDTNEETLYPLADVRKDPTN